MMPLAGSGEFSILQSHIDAWVGAYPGVDLIRQLAAMRQWCVANPRKRKTKRGVLAFCNSWLAKEQDRSSTRLPAAGGGRPAQFDLVAHVKQGSHTIIDVAHGVVLACAEIQNRAQRIGKASATGDEMRVLKDGLPWLMDFLRTVSNVAIARAAAAAVAEYDRNGVVRV
ncbi:hypothetical protein GTP46_04620 [Duganella sp. FT135W]|uniref:Uncharacterized protein n=1 Tax=Duganella flavida TaxID=2692175 RepID=A0A6L8K7P1_9BURK|nr:hypothetical protein [Duganella flavida]MYM21934.1 hypothetical protein [Duganella flavida]